MSEPLLVTSLDELADTLVDVTVIRPDGRELTVTLRPLTEVEMRALRQAITWPEPPVTEFRKTADGRVVPERNRSDPSYRRALEDAEAELMHRTLLAMLQLEIPGADEAERLDNLRAKLGQAVSSQLIAAAQRLNIVGLPEVAAVARSFRPRGAARPDRGGPLGIDPAPMAEAETE